MNMPNEIITAEKAYVKKKCLQPSQSVERRIIVANNGIGVVTANHIGI